MNPNTARLPYPKKAPAARSSRPGSPIFNERRKPQARRGRVRRSGNCIVSKSMAARAIKAQPRTQDITWRSGVAASDQITASRTVAVIATLRPEREWSANRQTTWSQHCPNTIPAARTSGIVLQP